MTTLQTRDLGHIRLNTLETGTPEAPGLVFAHPLGTNLHFWDAVRAHLPDTLRILCYDIRGHGGSDVPAAPYAMGQLVTDAEVLLDHLNIRDCLFVGAGLGGLIAQGLAVKRLDQVRALALANTAAKIGIKPHWNTRIEALKARGMQAETAQFMERTFTKSTKSSSTSQLWHDVLSEIDPQGYIGCCSAISGTDFYTPTASLRLPCLGLAGLSDRVTPPDLMRETIELIPGAEFKLVGRSGHFSAVENPLEFAKYLRDFCTQIGHI